VQVGIRETKFLHLNIQFIQRDKDRWTEHDQSSLPIYRFMLFLETVLEKSRRCSVDFLATEDSLVTAVTGRGGLGSERALHLVNEVHCNTGTSLRSCCDGTTT
jgi:hypothetical protein